MAAFGIGIYFQRQERKRRELRKQQQMTRASASTFVGLGDVSPKTVTIYSYPMWKQEDQSPTPLGPIGLGDSRKQQGEMQKKPD